MTGPVNNERLEVRGAWWGWLAPSLAVASLVAVTVLGSIIALSVLKLPWMFPDANSIPSDPRFLASVVIFSLGVALALAKDWFQKRAGRVELSDERLVFSRRGIFRKVIRWTEIAGYSDGSSTWIDTLLRGDAAPRPHMTIPTRTEAARVGVLRLLDAHGVPRVEVRPRVARRLVHATAFGVGAILLFLSGVYLANARWRKFNEFAAGRLPREEARARLHDWANVRHRMRSVTGARDGILVETIPGFEDVQGIFVPATSVCLNVTTRVEIDGRAVGRSSSMGFCYEVGSLLGFLGGYRYELPLFVDKDEHRLAPGRHELRAITQLDLKGTECVTETRTTIEVLPDSIAARTVKMVPGPSPDLTVEEHSWGGGWGLMCSYSDLRHALVARVEIFEGENKVGQGMFKAPAHETGSRSFEDLCWGAMSLDVPSGKHTLRVRFTPDAVLAFEHDVDLTEIHGEPFERVIEVNVP